MTFEVIFSLEAVEGLERLFDYVLERELNSHTGNLDLPERAIQAVKKGCEFLAHSPFSCRKAGDSPFVRELLIPFGATGYVALFEIRGNQQVIIGAVRHQRKDDYH